MKLLSYFLLIAIPLTCGGGSGSSNYDNSAVVSSYEFDYEYDTKSAVLNDNPGNSADIDYTKESMKIIRDARLRFETKNSETTFIQITEAVKQQEGFIQNDQISRSYDTERRYLEIRVPSKNFDALIESLSAQVDYFDEKSITSKDVTEEYIDIEARLGAKKTLEQRYLELLKSAKNVSEILDIERELAKIRADIEAAQGRLNYLQNQVSMSTVNIEFYKTKVTTITSKSYGAKMIDAIVSGFNGLSVFFLGLLHIWPFILILLFGVFLLKKYLKKQQKS